jgi:hypothetical protein
VAGQNRYAGDWNAYSARWEGEYGGRYEHLGEEWNDDGTATRDRDAGVVRELRRLPDELRTVLDSLLDAAQNEDDYQRRIGLAARIRRLLRGC